MFGLFNNRIVSITFGVIFLAFGVLLLLNNFQIVVIDLTKFWPLALVAVGVALIFHDIGR